MTELWQRLRQRKIVQWVLAYVAASFALLQAIDIVAAKFGWPDSVERMLIIAACVGFFVTLVLAWYHGERGTQKVTGMELLIVTLLLALGGGFLWHYASSPTVSNASKPLMVGSTAKSSTQSAPAAARTSITATSAISAKSIAVLPFENLSADKDNAYFADGMQDLILTKLADIGDLKVISRTSTMQYGSHPQNLKTIAQQLGVAKILEGSVQKAGNQVLINVQLIDARTDSHLWAESYTRDLKNIFGVEGEVAGKVADALKARLSPAEAAAVANIPTKDPAAYDAYLRGEHYLEQTLAGNFTVLPKAVAAFQQAVDRDPQFALAWAQLSFCQGALIYASIDVSDATRRQALASARHALALAPDLPRAHYALGYVYRFGFADYGKALAQFRIARRGAPNDAEVEAAIAYIQGIRGDIPAAVASLRRATGLNPRDPNLALGLGWGLTDLRHYDQAASAFRRALAIAPNDPEAYTALAQLQVLQHADVPAALALLDKAPTDLQSGAEIRSARVEQLLLKRDYQAAQRIVDTLQPGGRFVTPLRVLMLRAKVSRLSGDSQGAKALYQQALGMATTAASKGLNEAALHGEAAIPIVQAGLGHRAEALRALENVRVLASKMDVGGLVDGLSLARAKVYVMLGDSNAAIAPLDKALALPLGRSVSVPLLTLDPSWDPLRKDPPFQGLLVKYAHAQPAMHGSVAGQH